MDFIEFPKIARFNREVIITEKIDGTNAQVTWEPVFYDDPEPTVDRSLGVFAPTSGDTPMRLWVGSRNRWIVPGDDHFGFARWVYDHALPLYALGAGSHFGEWWGAGIGRRYGLTEKRWSLFNVERWGGERPECCHVVPELARGVLGLDVLQSTVMMRLQTLGSVAAPGFMNPEGIVIYHTAARTLFKATLQRDSEWKGATQAA